MNQATLTPQQRADLHAEARRQALAPAEVVVLTAEHNLALTEVRAKTMVRDARQALDNAQADLAALQALFPAPEEQE